MCLLILELLMSTSVVTPTGSAESTPTTPIAFSASVVIFGASGDLTARKLLPALYDLWNDGYLSDASPIIGVARREKTDETFRNEMFEAINGHVRSGNISVERWNEFSKRLFYRQLDIATPDGYPKFRHEIEKIGRAHV